jgi:hypothetical protein
VITATESNKAEPTVNLQPCAPGRKKYGPHFNGIDNSSIQVPLPQNLTPRPTEFVLSQYLMRCKNGTPHKPPRNTIPTLRSLSPQLSPPFRPASQHPLLYCTPNTSCWSPASATARYNRASQRSFVPLLGCRPFDAMGI